MASTPTLLNSEAFTTNATSYTTTSWAYTPSTTLLELVCVWVCDDGGGSPVPTLSGCGMTWSAYTDGTTSANVLGTGSRVRSRIYRAVSGTPSSGDLTISTGAVTCERAGIALISISETTPGNAVQIVTGSGSSTSPSVTLAAVADSANLILGVVSNRNPVSTFTVGSGFTSLVSTSIESDLRVSVEYSTNDTTVDGTLGSSGNWTMIGVEIDNVPAAAGSVPAIVASYRRRRAL